MGMVGAGIDLELPELLGAEARVGQHALDRPANGLLGPPLQQVAEALLLEALGKAAVAGVGLRVVLVGGDGDLRGVQDDHVVTGVEVRRPHRLVLAPEDAGDARGEATEGLVRRIDDKPFPLDLAFAHRIGLRVHWSSIVSCCSWLRSLVFRPVRPSATLRRQSPRAGAAAPAKAGCVPRSAASMAVSSIRPVPTPISAATIRRTIPRRNALARMSIVTSSPRRLTRIRWMVRTGWGSVPPKAEKSWRPWKIVAALAIASTSSAFRTRYAVRS